MTVVFEAYAHLLHAPFVFAVPTPALISRLMLMAALPILAGMGLRHLKPGWVARYGRMVRNLSLAGFGFLLLYVLVTRHEQLTAEWQPTVATYRWTCDEP